MYGDENHFFIPCKDREETPPEVVLYHGQRFRRLTPHWSFLSKPRWIYVRHDLLLPVLEAHLSLSDEEVRSMTAVKWVSRWQLMFSPTVSCRIPGLKILVVEDREKNKDDGNGWISERAAEILEDQLRDSDSADSGLHLFTEEISAFQIRVRSARGVVLVRRDFSDFEHLLPGKDQKLEPLLLVLNKSMVKWDCDAQLWSEDDKVIDVRNVICCRPQREATTNKELNLVLEHHATREMPGAQGVLYRRGGRKTFRLLLQELLVYTYMQSLHQILGRHVSSETISNLCHLCDKDSKHKNYYKGVEFESNEDGSDSENNYDGDRNEPTTRSRQELGDLLPAVSSGLSVTRHPALMLEMARRLRGTLHKQVRQQKRLKIPNSGYYTWQPDPTGTMLPGEFCLWFTREGMHECVLRNQGKASGVPESTKKSQQQPRLKVFLAQGSCLVVKPPSYEPGNLLAGKFVNPERAEKLRRLVRCTNILFCGGIDGSGGDYDGDKVLVAYDQGFVQAITGIKYPVGGEEKRSSNGAGADSESDSSSGDEGEDRLAEIAKKPPKKRLPTKPNKSFKAPGEPEGSLVQAGMNLNQNFGHPHPSQSESESESSDEGKDVDSGGDQDDNFEENGDTMENMGEYDENEADFGDDDELGIVLLTVTAFSMIQIEMTM